MTDASTVTDARPVGERPRPIARALLSVVVFYQGAISPLRPPSCRYLPTCSAYAVEAIQTYGAGHGTWMALRRLLRCHPLHAGGHDPVPPRVASADVPSLTTTRTAA